VGWSTGAEVGAGVTPERRKQVIESIKSFGVKAVFVETSVNPKLVREIAAEAGVRVGGELYSDSMGTAGSAGDTYIGMMRENVLTIADSLK
jgi:manganese/iron transport system substrate-binding protein